MVSRNQQCSGDNGITTKSRGWSEKTLMIFAPILIIYYLGRVNERKKRIFVKINVKRNLRIGNRIKQHVLPMYASMFLGIQKENLG